MKTETAVFSCVVAAALFVSSAFGADESRRYDGRTYGIDIFDSNGTTFPTVHFGSRTFQFAYRTDGYGVEDERPVKFHGMKSRDYRGEATEKGFKASFVHDLHLVDGEKTGEKIGEARTEIRCADGLVGVQTTITPSFPGRFLFRHGTCFSQVVVFPGFARTWVGTTLVTTDDIGGNRMNLMMPHEEFDFNRWGMNGRNLRTVVFGNVPEVMTFKADQAATLTVNRYRGGFECNASLRHPHPQCRPTPWDGPVVYRYSFKMER